MVGGTRRQVLVALGVLAVGGAGVATVGVATGGSRAEDAAIAPSGTAVQSVSPTRLHARGGTRVRLTGTGLAGVTAVRLAGATVPVAHASAARVEFVAPPAARFASGTAAVTLHAGAHHVASAAVEYAALDGIDRQLQYLLRHWKDYDPAYQPLGTTDCVDFASQSLLVRGWKQQGEWRHAENVYRSGAAWISSTAFRDFMTAHPELGTALTDDQRSRVRLGDVVQFDWDRTGDRDHTGVVTRITDEHGRIRIGFAGHTMDSDYRDVDEAITKDHPGGRAYYWRFA